MSAPISLVARRLEPVPDVVKALEELLESARQGEIRAVAFACVRSDNTSYSGWERGIDPGDETFARINSLQVALGYTLTVLHGRYFHFQYSAADNA